MRNQFVRSISTFTRQALNAAVRLIVTSIVFTTTVVLVLRTMGVPMPSPHELLREVEGLSGLSRILS